MRGLLGWAVCFVLCLGVLLHTGYAGCNRSFYRTRLRLTDDGHTHTVVKLLDKIFTNRREFSQKNPLKSLFAFVTSISL